MCGFWSWELCISSVVPRLWDASDASGTQVNKTRRAAGPPLYSLGVRLALSWPALWGMPDGRRALGCDGPCGRRTWLVVQFAWWALFCRERVCDTFLFWSTFAHVYVQYIYAALHSRCVVLVCPPGQELVGSLPQLNENPQPARAPHPQAELVILRGGSLLCYLDLNQSPFCRYFNAVRCPGMK